MGQSEGYQYITELHNSGVPFLCIINFKGDQIEVMPLSAIDREKVLFEINGLTNAEKPATIPSLVKWEKLPIGVNIYEDSYQKVMHHLHRGDSYLVNLTFGTPVITNLTLKEFFYASQARYKLWLDDEFVVFSPERFIRIENQIISAYPMKGTIAANIPNAPQRILSNQKELEEHHTIVDLLRNDLSMVATQVGVNEFRYLELIRNAQKDLWQVSSEISGTLLSQFKVDLGATLRNLLPAGSVSGAPKKRTLEIIESAEISSRGYFTGIVGLFDGSVFDSGVMIRYLEKSATGLIFRSGGGITVNSILTEEYQEMIDKVYAPVI